MGSHFKLISDELIKPLAASLQGPCCDCCEMAVPQYFVYGPIYYIELALRNSLVPRAIHDEKMDRVCLTCLKELHSAVKLSAWREAWRSLRSSGGGDLFWPLRRIWLARELARTPRGYASFAQRVDWPVCCKQLCEFTGWPDRTVDLKTLDDERVHWREGPQTVGAFHEFPDTEDPTTDVSLFRCGGCGRTYYTHQHS